MKKYYELVDDNKIKVWYFRPSYELTSSILIDNEYSLESLDGTVMEYIVAKPKQSLEGFPKGWQLNPIRKILYKNTLYTQWLLKKLKTIESLYSALAEADPSMNLLSRPRLISRLICEALGIEDSEITSPKYQKIAPYLTTLSKRSYEAWEPEIKIISDIME